jgi:hypothetical protein
MHSLSIPLVIFIIKPPFRVLTIPGNPEVEELKTLWESSTEEIIDISDGMYWEGQKVSDDQIKGRLVMKKLKLNYNQNNQRFTILSSRDSLFFYLPPKIQSKTHNS